jgi:tetratricopeptide (TPR) repeat protein
VRTWIVCLGLLALAGCSSEEAGLIEDGPGLAIDTPDGGQPPQSGEAAAVFTHRLSGLDAFKRGDLDAAVAEFTRALELSPDSKTYYNRGVAHSAAGRHEPAIADYSAAVRLDPANADAYFNRGVAHGQLGKTAEALNDLGDAIRLNPADPKGYLFRGTLFLNERELERAHADFTRALELDPKCAEAYTNRGHVACLKRDYDAALRDLDEAVRIDPKSALAYNHRGNVYSKQWRQLSAVAVRLAGGNGPAELAGKALADFNEAIRLDPQDAEAYNNRGAVHAELGDHPRAIADFTAAIQRQPSLAAAYRNRGNSYLETADPQKAAADYRAAVRLDPAGNARIPEAYRDPPKGK